MKGFRCDIRQTWWTFEILPSISFTFLRSHVFGWDGSALELWQAQKLKFRSHIKNTGATAFEWCAFIIGSMIYFCYLFDVKFLMGQRNGYILQIPTTKYEIPGHSHTQTHPSKPRLSLDHTPFDHAPFDHAPWQADNNESDPLRDWKWGGNSSAALSSSISSFEALDLLLEAVTNRQVHACIQRCHLQNELVDTQACSCNCWSKKVDVHAHNYNAWNELVYSCAWS